ncbi:MAG: hypothetical protein GF350_17575 [Chitinivibrionales bacterium]|nr:hypothetical protein [Chitinivibrionales bacterium]
MDSIFLVITGGRLAARSSQINSYGTHCAFLYNDGGWHVAVTTVGGVNKTVKKICSVPDGGDFGDGRLWTAKLEWPRGEWIWFTNSKNNNQIYRVHVQTGDRQHIADVNTNSNQFQMPACAKIAIGAYGGDAGLIRLPDPSSGGLPATINQMHNWGGACGHGISPSGIYALANNNGYHNRVCILKVDTNTWIPTQDESVGLDGNVGRIETLDGPILMWDDWALDSSMKNEAYNDKTLQYTGFYQVIGGGNSTQGGWSSNSNHWAMMICGWAPQGRDLENGANLIGLNFIREQTLPFTHNYCEYDTINNPEGIRYIAYNGDIWISDPVEDIAPGYIDDFNNRDAYTIEGTDTEVDARVNVLWENVGVKDCNGIRVDKHSGLTFSLKDRKNVRIEVYSGLGKLIYSQQVQEQQIHIPRSVLHRGVNMVIIKDTDGIVFAEKMMKM